MLQHKSVKRNQYVPQFADLRNLLIKPNDK